MAAHARASTAPPGSRAPGHRLRRASGWSALFCYRTAGARGAAGRNSSARPSRPACWSPPGAHAAALPRGLRPARRARHRWLPTLPQPDFDRLLWACDLNFVRGEDSLVRALWAGAPFVWQIYPQDDDAHHEQAGRLPGLAAGAAEAARLHHLWSGIQDGDLPLLDRGHRWRPGPKRTEAARARVAARRTTF